MIQPLRASLSVFCALFCVGAAAEPALPPSVVAVPAPGRADVPLNPLILVQNNGLFEVVVVDDGAAIVPSSSTAVADAAFNSLSRVSLSEDLRPQTTYRVLLRETVNDAGDEVTSFVTGDAVDDTAPGDFDASVEGNVLAVDADEELAVVDVRIGAGTSQLYPLTDQQTQVFASQSTTVTVVGLDFAGNTTDPVDVAVTGVGCGACASSSSSPSSLAPWAALLLLLSRRRKSADPAAVFRRWRGAGTRGNVEA